MYLLSFDVRHKILVCKCQMCLLWWFTNKQLILRGTQVLRLLYKIQKYSISKKLDLQFLKIFELVFYIQGNLVKGTPPLVFVNLWSSLQYSYIAVCALANLIPHNIQTPNIQTGIKFLLHMKLCFKRKVFIKVRMLLIFLWSVLFLIALGIMLLQVIWRMVCNMVLFYLVVATWWLC